MTKSDKYKRLTLFYHKETYIFLKGETCIYYIEGFDNKDIYNYRWRV